MKISLLNEKILFQKGVVVSDAIGNRKNAWEDYYSCFATISGEGGTEKSEAGLTISDSDISFSVRYCKAVAGITSDEYRIVFRGVIYNIIAIDHMNYKKRSVKFKCQRVRR